jgi:hypothetical protein
LALRGGRRRTTRRARRTGGGLRSPLTALIVAISLVVQLFAATTPPALAAPAFAGADEATVAAELKAVFGDAADLCAQINDHAAPGKHAPSGHCCDQCPLCRFAAQAMAFVPPEVPALPARVNADSRAIRAGPDFRAVLASAAKANRARAPPLSV